MHVHLSEIDKTTEARATILCWQSRLRACMIHGPNKTWFILVGMENTARDSVDTNTYLRMAKRYEAVA